MGDFAEDPVHRQLRLGENTNEMGSDCPVKETSTICSSSNFCLSTRDKVPSIGVWEEIMVSDELQYVISRDYVVAARKNGIADNWPFHSKHLDFCRRHDITSVLPPFEPRLSAKRDSCKKDKDFSHHLSLKEESLSANTIDENSDINIARSEQIDKSGADIWMKEAIVDISKHICSLTIGAGRNGHCRCGKEGFRDLNKNKSCFSELRKIPELIYQEKNLGFTSTVSTQIPNASLPSTLKFVKISKRKGEPKTRLLVDIYAEAKHITLEETDQINSYHYREISAVNGDMKYNKKSELHSSVFKKKHSKDLRENHFPNKKRCVRMLRPKEC